MVSNKLNAFLALIAVLGIGLACGLDSNDKDSSVGEPGTGTESDSLPRKLDSYSIKGINFAFYLIPAGLDREALIETAEKIHADETDTQLILVDDDSKVTEYIKYAKAISGLGEIEGPMPQEWADKHIVANLQKYMNGRWVLCKGNGSEELADLKKE
jgi:hypothetical protein